MKKKKGRKRCIMLLIVLLAGAAAACYYGENQKKAEAAQTGQSTVEAGDGQTIIYAQIDSITGNEITIQLLEIPYSKNSETSGEQRDYLIPVGTQVETRLGSITTFSRLTAGDNIAILLEPKEDREEIVKIWIVE